MTNKLCDRAKYFKYTHSFLKKFRDEIEAEKRARYDAVIKNSELRTAKKAEKKANSKAVEA